MQDLQHQQTKSRKPKTALWRYFGCWAYWSVLFPCRSALPQDLCHLQQLERHAGTLWAFRDPQVPGHFGCGFAKVLVFQVAVCRSLKEFVKSCMSRLQIQVMTSPALHLSHTMLILPCLEVQSILLLGPSRSVCQNSHPKIQARCGVLNQTLWEQQLVPKCEPLLGREVRTLVRNRTNQ